MKNGENVIFYGLKIRTRIQNRSKRIELGEAISSSDYSFCLMCEYTGSHLVTVSFSDFTGQ